MLRRVAGILAKVNDLFEIVAGSGDMTNGECRRNRLLRDVLSDEEDDCVPWLFA